MTEKPLRNKVAVVTGASRGIGAAIALACAAAGADVGLVARSPQPSAGSPLSNLSPDGGEALRTVAERARALGVTALPLGADVSDEAQVRAALARVAARWARIDVLVNCAGIGAFGPVAETSTADWDRVMAVNARGPFLMCREALPLLARDGQPCSMQACILNVASVVGVKGYVNQAAYTASKHALMGFTKVLAQELQPEGIRVHALCPGGVDTDLISDARPDLDRSVLMTAEEVAAVAMFLITQRGNAVVDQINLRRAVSSPWFC